MEYRSINMPPRKNIALVAHDNKKHDLYEWSKFNRETLAQHRLYATASTGAVLERQLGLRIEKLESGPAGGNQQIDAKIAQGEIDFVVFFWDPLQMLPHDPDIKALLRSTAVWNVPVACNRATADFLISSPLMSREYLRLVHDYPGYTVLAILTPESSSTHGRRSIRRRKAGAHRRDSTLFNGR